MTVRDRLWVNYAEILSDAAERIFDIVHHNLNKATLRHWASVGCREFARRSEVLKGTYLTVLVAGQAEYRLPEDCIRPKLVAAKYPGWTGFRRMDPTDEEDDLDGTQPVSGTPYQYYLSHDRRSIGLVDTPNAGGFLGYTASVAGDDTSIVGPATMNANDDYYNGKTVRILSGTEQDEERTVTAYDGTTKTLTVDSAYSAPVAGNVRFAVYPDTLRIDYIRGGNSYAVTPTAAAVVSAPVVNTFETLELTLPQRAKDFWEGCEVTLPGDVRTRILTSSWIDVTSQTRVSVAPDLPALASADDVVTVTDVPNIPPAFHDALVSYVVHRALQRERHPQAAEHLATFLESVEEAMQRDRPADAQEFKQIREYGRGEEEEW